MSEHEHLANFIHREALRVLHRNTRRTPCVVDSYDPKKHAVKVKLMPDSVDEPVVTGWLPLHPLQTGNSFGWHMPPNIGDHGWVEFHDDDREAGQFVLAVFDQQFQPVNNVQAGEWLYKNKWGSLVYFKNDGSVTVADKAGSTIIFDGNGTVTLKGKSGNEAILQPNGDIGIAPASSQILYLGGTGSDGHTYDFVQTVSSPSINVKARIS